MAKVRAQFDAAGPLIGRPWPLHYRDTDDALVETLRSFGIERFTRAVLRAPARTWPTGSTTGPPTSRPACPRRWCAAPSSPRSRLRRTSKRGSTPSRCSRSTCRSATSRHRPAARRDLGTGRRGRHPGGAARREWPGADGVHRTGAGRRAARAAPAAAAGDRAHGGAGVCRVPRAGRDARAGAPRHHDGVHRLLLRDGRRLSRPTCCRGCATSGSAARCCSGRTSRTSPIPTSTSSSRSNASTSATTGCAPCATTTRRALLWTVRTLTDGTMKIVIPGEPVRSVGSCVARWPAARARGGGAQPAPSRSPLARSVGTCRRDGTASRWTGRPIGGRC